ncbi:MAG TPA: M56 family metallopeptidase [Verrucomicrobiae bacterium]|jgi:beta-lactamase regulating signal transducer with metallopeptidase domain|nr:M56 family metallopeptidase [Verrucomicrobiae bacterium]
MQDFIEYRLWPLLLKASWQAGALILLVLLARWALRCHISPRWRHGLWLLVVVRLALPGTVPSPVSLFNVLNFSRTSETLVRWEAAIPQQSAVPQVAATPASSVNFSWLPMVWLAGVCGLAIWLAVTHWRLVRRITPNRPLIDGEVMNLLEDCKELMGVRVPVTLVETGAVDGPCLFGFLRPRLLLPPGFTRNFSPDELRHVFLHELGHIKRNDIPLGWLMAALQILHWFNPAVWLAFSRMRMDRELACDALALSYAQEPDGKPYGRTIVKLLTSFGDSLRAPGLAGIVEDKHQMKERISMIAKFQKTDRLPLLAGAVFIILGVLTLTDCKSANPPDAVSETAGGAPRIIATSPKIGARKVDPMVKEIAVTFDQDMGRGMSWTGGGPDFPKIPAGIRAKWRDKRTCVLPVLLEQGHYYRVGINSTSYQNFRSVAGVPADPAAIYFTTRGAGEELQAKARAPKLLSCDPPNGAQDVSVSVTELRVTFDVPMGGGMSWCSMDDDDRYFPKGREGAHAYWTEDKKTCVLPVSLKPGMTYRISLNAPEYKNFQSDGGVPLEPVAYAFKTGAKN